MDETSLEITSDRYFPAGLTFPRRPPWNFDTSRLELDCRENRYFTVIPKIQNDPCVCYEHSNKLSIFTSQEYLYEIHKNFEKDDSVSIDRNIENWRQLWRVMEMSDILLLVVDIRFPVSLLFPISFDLIQLYLEFSLFVLDSQNLLFPPTLYDYIVGKLHKHMIVVLNKIDLAPPSLVAAWKHYFTKQYPELKIVLFTSFPSYNLRDGGGSSSGIYSFASCSTASIILILYSISYNF